MNNNSSILIDRKSVSIFRLLNFSLRILFWDKVILILNMITAMFSIIFPIMFAFIKSGSQVVMMFSFYFMINSLVLLFLLFMRSAQIFLINKIEDKTVYIMSVQNSSRSNILLSFWLSSLVFGIVFVLIGFILDNLLYSIFSFSFDPLMLRLTASYLGYSLIVSVFLSTFFFALVLMVKASWVTIISTSILVLNFISTLPYQFIIQNTNDQQIGFRTNNVDSNGINDTFQMRVEDLYGNIDFYNAVTKGKFKYPQLSKNIFTTYDSLQFGSSASKNSEAVLRVVNTFWKEKVGLATKDIVFDEMKEFEIKTLPDSWKSDGFEVNDSVKLKNFSIKQKLILPGDEVLIRDERMLNQFKDFSNFILKKTGSWKAIQESITPELITPYLKISEDSIIENEKGKTRKLTNEDFAVAYSAFFNNETTNKNALSFNSQLGPDGNPGQNWRDLVLVPENGDENKSILSRTTLALIVLQNYFTKYMDGYFQISNHSKDELSYTLDVKSYKKYQSTINNYAIGRNFNFIGHLIENFTEWSGYASDDVWFEPLSGKVDFRKQQNIFLPYKMYKISVAVKSEPGKQGDMKIHFDKSVNNYTPPWVYLVFESFVAVGFITVAIVIFNRKDLK